MTNPQSGPVNADRLKSFIERIEKLVEERKAIQGDIKDVFSEAKGVGFDVPTMRKVLALRAMDAADRDEMETLIDVYWHALSAPKRTALEAMQRGAGTREAARTAGIAVGAASQLRTGVHGIENGEHVHETQIGEQGDGGSAIIEPPHDPETGEIKQIEDAAPQPEPPPGNGTPQPVPEGGEGTGTNSDMGIPMSAESCGGGLKGPDSIAKPGALETPPRHAGVAPGPQDTSPRIEADQPAVVDAVAEPKAERVAPTLPAPEAWQGITSVREEHEARSDLVREAERENRAFDHHRRDARNRIVDADDLAQPSFLKRHRETVTA